MVAAEFPTVRSNALMHEHSGRFQHSWCKEAISGSRCTSPPAHTLYKRVSKECFIPNTDIVQWRQKFLTRIRSSDKATDVYLNDVSVAGDACTMYRLQCTPSFWCPPSLAAANGAKPYLSTCSPLPPLFLLFWQSNGFFSALTHQNT